MEKNNTNIGLDIDGVLAGFRTKWIETYLDVVNSKSWDFDKNMQQRFNDMIKNNVLDDFYLSLPPLIKPEDIPFEPHCYITARPVDSHITKKWLKLHGFPIKPVITVGINKSKINAAKENNVNIFVDDNYNNFNELNDSGILTYLYTTPWNEMHNVGHLRINSLKDISLFR